ncbi:MAG: hypothetical protein CM15mP83_8240 [Flavobacteriaceae bacterium]|nr:MAG: hypothetical protein CM15mP83_8240 [Flavobacteriaceae bacterium]
MKKDESEKQKIGLSRMKVFPELVSESHGIKSENSRACSCSFNALKEKVYDERARRRLSKQQRDNELKTMLKTLIKKLKLVLQKTIR